MKKILIIRSVSFQQLDLNLPEIIKKYGECEISLLTHEHGVKLAKKYANIDNIYVYPYKGGFSYKNKVKELNDKEFDIVIVPVTNIDGGGFFNVLKFSKSIKSVKKVMCNVVSEFTEFTMADLYIKQIKNYLYRFISILASIIISPVILIILIYKLVSIRKV